MAFHQAGTIRLPMKGMGEKAKGTTTRKEEEADETIEEEEGSRAWEDFPFPFCWEEKASFYYAIIEPLNEMV